MPLLTDPDTLSQGSTFSPTGVTFASVLGPEVTINGTNLPLVEPGAFFEIRGHSDPENNGLYREDGQDSTAPTTSSIAARKLDGTNPIANTVGEAITVLATLTTRYTGNGVAVTSASANTATLTTSDTFPTTVAGNFITFRGFTEPANNTVYKIVNTPGANSIDVVAVDTTLTMVNESAKTTAESDFDPKNVHFDVLNREIWLMKEGSLSDDGVTLQAVYSFSKEEWKNDITLIPHPYPFVAITPEQFEMSNDWVPHTGPVGGPSGDPNDRYETRKLIRTGGWREIAANGTLNQEHVGVITLGTFEDNVNDLAYFQQGNDPTDITAAQNFTFNGPVNEAIKSYDYITTGPFSAQIAITGTNTITRSDSGGSWLDEGYRVGGQITIVSSDQSGNVGTFVIATLTDTVLTVSGTPLTNDADDVTFTAAVNNRNVLNVFLRIRDGDTNGKTFDSSNLSAIGVTEVDNKVFRFPLSNVTDLDITATDASITGGTPWTEIRVRYFDAAFSRDVDLTSTTNELNRSFGIVIDVGTYSGVDGSITTSGSTLTSADGGFSSLSSDFNSGTLTIHNSSTAANNTTYTLAATAVLTDTTIDITPSTFNTADTGLSFTLQRQAGKTISATTNQIYEKVQYLLRQDANINYHGDEAGTSPTTAVVTGSTADALLRFVGTELESGQAIPTNPNFTDGTGVIVEGFLETDTNKMTFFDNTETLRTFPFVASGTISFNQNLQDDSEAYYWMFFTYTVRTTPTGAVTMTLTSGNQGQLTAADDTIDLPVVVENEYIAISGFDDEVNNGIFRVGTVTDQTTGGFTVYKVDVSDVLITSTATAGAVSIDEDPIDSPDAIIVRNNDDVEIKGDVAAAASTTFTFDYDNNAQGERVAGQGDAAVTLRAIGFNSAQFVETSGTIGQSDANNFSLVAALERNYSNVA